RARARARIARAGGDRVVRDVVDDRSIGLERADAALQVAAVLPAQRHERRRGLVAPVAARALGLVAAERFAQVRTRVAHERLPVGREIDPLVRHAAASYTANAP